MSKLELSDCSQIFDMIDKKLTGSIPTSEVGSFLRGAQLNPTESELKKIIDELGGENAKVTLEQAYAQYSSYFSKQKPKNRQHFIEMLKIFDRDGNQTIYSSDIRNLLTNMGDKLKQSELEFSVSGLENAQGMVNIGDYVDAVMSGN